MANDMQRLVVALEARTKAFENALNKANGTANRRARSIETRFSKMNGAVTRQFGLMGKSMVGAFAGAITVRGAQQLIDGATRIQNALKVTGLEGENLTKVYDKLYESAQNNAAPLESLVTLYSRLALVQGELGVSTEQITGFTDKVAVALRVAGTDAQSASGALLQLSQALGGGTVRAEEFSSISEGALPILQAVAAGIEEAGGSVAKLRKLVIDGKLSSEAFFKGFEAGAVTLETKVASSQMTISQSMTLLGNAMQKAAGKFDEATGASARFAGGIGNVASAVDEFDMSGFIKEIQDSVAALDSLFARMGNSDIFKRFNEYFGLTSPENLASYGMTPVDYASDRVAAASGQMTAGGKTGRLPEKVKPIKASDYAPPDDGKSAAERADEYERLAARIADSTASLVAETEVQRQLNPLVDDFGYAIERARLEQDLMNAAIEAGKEVTPGLRAEIGALADQYARASAEAAHLAKTQDDARANAEAFGDIASSTMGDFVQDLRNGVSATDALTNAAANLAAELLQMAINAAIKKLVEMLLGGFSGGGIVGGGSFPAAPSGGGTGGLYDSGGYTGPGGRKTPAGIVHKGEVVFNQDDVRKFGGPGKLNAMRLAGPSMPQIAAPSVPSIAPHRAEAVPVYAPTLNINAPNAQPGVREEIEAAGKIILQQVRKEFPQNTAKALKTIKTMGYK